MTKVDKAKPFSLFFHNQKHDHSRVGGQKIHTSIANKTLKVPKTHHHKKRPPTRGKPR